MNLWINFRNSVARPQLWESMTDDVKKQLIVEKEDHIMNVRDKTRTDSGLPKSDMIWKHSMYNYDLNQTMYSTQSWTTHTEMILANADVFDIPEWVVKQERSFFDQDYDVEVIKYATAKGWSMLKVGETGELNLTSSEHSEARAVIEKIFGAKQFETVYLSVLQEPRNVPTELKLEGMDETEAYIKSPRTVLKRMTSRNDSLSVRRYSSIATESAKPLDIDMTFESYDFETLMQELFN